MTIYLLALALRGGGRAFPGVSPRMCVHDNLIILFISTGNSLVRRTGLVWFTSVREACRYKNS